MDIIDKMLASQVLLIFEVQVIIVNLLLLLKLVF